MTDRRALLIFARVPVPGTVKTRLASALSLEDAARLYYAFLRDSVQKFSLADVELRVYFAPGEAGIPPDVLPAHASVFMQRGKDLGQRMLNAFVETFAAGYERVVLIGSDHPTLPREFVLQAFEALHEPFQIVIGPATDGGYYLLGMNELYPVLFQRMAYSRADVFAETLERVGASEAGLTILPEWYDVDTPDALMRLIREIDAGTTGVPHTEQVLHVLRDRYDQLRS